MKDRFRIIRYRRAVLLMMAVLGMAWLAAGCGDDEGPVAVGPATGSVIFSFDHEVGDSALVLESSQTNFPYTNAAGNPYNVSALEYFVSNFHVHRADGAVFGADVAHFRDADDTGASRSFTLSGIPPGTYSAVSFTFGLDAKTNVTNGILDEQGLPIVELVWPDNWGGGYHYMEMDGQYDSGAGIIGYTTHTGRRFIEMAGDISGEGPDSVAFHHFFEVFSNVTPFQVDGNTWEVTAIMDINGWYQNPIVDFRTFFTGAPQDTIEAIMVNLPAQRLFMQNGINNVYRITDAVLR